jgi:hypothetical protein
MAQSFVWVAILAQKRQKRPVLPASKRSLAGPHDGAPAASNAVGLVYIAAFGLDKDESIDALLSQGPVTSALAHMIVDAQGSAWLSEDDFVNHFAADVHYAIVSDAIREGGHVARELTHGGDQIATIEDASGDPAATP